MSNIDFAVIRTPVSPGELAKAFCYRITARSGDIAGECIDVRYDRDSGQIAHLPRFVDVSENRAQLEDAFFAVVKDAALGKIEHELEVKFRQAFNIEKVKGDWNGYIITVRDDEILAELVGSCCYELKDGGGTIPRSVSVSYDAEMDCLWPLGSYENCTDENDLEMAIFHGAEDAVLEVARADELQYQLEASACKEAEAKARAEFTAALIAATTDADPVFLATIYETGNSVGLSIDYSASLRIETATGRAVNLDEDALHAAKEAGISNPEGYVHVSDEPWRAINLRLSAAGFDGLGRGDILFFCSGREETISERLEFKAPFVELKAKLVAPRQLAAPATA